jgi:hypothetical protein
MTFNDYTLRFTFTIMGYVRIDDFATAYTIFSKDRDTAYPNNVVFRASITATDGFLKAEIADADDYTALGALTSTGTNKVPVKDWTLVGYSVTMQATAIDSTIRLWINGAAGETNTLSGRYYLDDVTAHKSYLGSHRSADSTTFAGGLKGFMYNFYIYNEEIATGTDSKLGGTSCHADCTGHGASCTVVVTDCIADYDFTEWAAGSAC